MGDFPTREELYKGQVERVAEIVKALWLPAFKPGAENREDRIATRCQLMTGDPAGPGGRDAELEILGTPMAVERRSPAEWIDLEIQSEAMNSDEAAEALTRARAWYRTTETPMPEALRKWQPSPKPRNRPKITGWRDAALALFVRKIVKASKKLPPELRLPISRNFATEKHLTLCDAVAEGWNRVFTAAAGDRTAVQNATYEIVLKAYNRDRRKRK